MSDTLTDLGRWLDARAALKAQQTALSDQLTVVDDTIRTILGDTTEATAGPWRVTYRHQETTRVDVKKVRQLLPPELLEAVQTTTETRVLRITGTTP